MQQVALEGEISEGPGWPGQSRPQRSGGGLEPERQRPGNIVPSSEPQRPTFEVWLLGLLRDYGALTAIVLAVATGLIAFATLSTKAGTIAQDIGEMKGILTKMRDDTLPELNRTIGANSAATEQLSDAVRLLTTSLEAINTRVIDNAKDLSILKERTEHIRRQ